MKVFFTKQADGSWVCTSENGAEYLELDATNLHLVTDQLDRSYSEWHEFTQTISIPHFGDMMVKCELWVDSESNITELQIVDEYARPIGIFDKQFVIELTRFPMAIS